MDTVCVHAGVTKLASSRAAVARRIVFIITRVRGMKAEVVPQYGWDLRPILQKSARKLCRSGVAARFDVGVFETQPAGGSNLSVAAGAARTNAVATSVRMRMASF